MSGTHLTLEERYLIHSAMLGGMSPTRIARQLKRDRSMIYDEPRGRGRGQYCPHVARSPARSGE
ncbi:MAG: helix-turn-helix domain-containing protein [Betaproteobacteria bacterium]|nr:helix-turn-helix domain-containing protein [Betaproteobacteria bacterium]